MAPASQAWQPTPEGLVRSRRFFPMEKSAGDYFPVETAEAASGSAAAAGGAVSHGGLSRRRVGAVRMRGDAGRQRPLRALPDLPQEGARLDCWSNQVYERIA